MKTFECRLTEQIGHRSTAPGILKGIARVIWFVLFALLDVLEPLITLALSIIALAAGLAAVVYAVAGTGDAPIFSLFGMAVVAAVLATLYGTVLRALEPR